MFAASEAQFISEQALVSAILQDPLAMGPRVQAAAVSTRDFGGCVAAADVRRSR
ncbi:hypothetical protein FHS40_009044 [Streptomyces spectabilis]|uniref:Uncharacterized protein n=1 Tax=Streptomyces spectabilis TaxID=68270 RepID=A0A7W8B3Y2_STRST|nr:hypothetical protein [Streptomyces spectabilis]